MSNGEFVQKTLSVDDLSSKAGDVSRFLVLKASKPVALANNVLSLLEYFKYQCKKLDRIGYCDSSLAFVCYQAGASVLEACEKLAVKSLEGFVDDLKIYLESLRSKFNAIESIVRAGSTSSGDLAERFASLKTGGVKSVQKKLSQLKYRDFISPAELNALMREEGLSVLLIDYRSKREFEYSHLNYSPILNIEPKLVERLPESGALDSDLESLLEESDSEMAKIFGNRHKFDIVVIYNTKFGRGPDDIFESLKINLIAETKKNQLPQNPFQKLIELMALDTKYISSRLKQFPLILIGGIEQWYNSFGDASLVRGELDDDMSRVKDAQSSKYLRRFDDYLKSGLPSSSSLSSTLQIAVDKASLGESDRSERVASSQLISQDNSHPREGIVSPKTQIQDYSVSKSGIPQSRSTRSEYLKPTPPSTKTHSEMSGPQKLAKYRSCSTGLTNLGNSCYMNCIIQCLIATPQLVSFLLSDSPGSSPDAYKQHINMGNVLGSQGRITTTFATLLTSMFNHDGSYVTPTTFKSTIGKLSPGQQFLTTEQQDCIEFLNFILDGLHEDLNQRQINDSAARAAISELSPEQEKAKEVLPVRLASTIEWERYLKLNFSVIVDFFQGQISSQLRCLECRMTSTTYNSFSTLSLPIPEKLGKGFSPVSLKECLDLFVETELLDADNKWHCPQCKKFSRSTKKITITRLPKILIIHFKRFKIQDGRFKKLENLITYPVNANLNMTPYWPPIGSYLSEQTTPSVSEDKEREILSSMPDRNQNPPFNYKLYGVVNHFGNLTTGHYTSYIKKLSAARGVFEWRYFDDARISRNCKEKDVLNSNAYCLFFERV